MNCITSMWEKTAKKLCICFPIYGASVNALWWPHVGRLFIRQLTNTWARVGGQVSCFESLVPIHNDRLLGVQSSSEKKISYHCVRMKGCTSMEEHFDPLSENDSDRELTSVARNAWIMSKSTGAVPKSGPTFQHATAMDGNLLKYFERSQLVK